MGFLRRGDIQIGAIWREDPEHACRSHVNFRRHAQKRICGLGLHVDAVDDRPGWPGALEWYAFKFSADMGGEK